jgi:hypothetical protein
MSNVGATIVVRFGEGADSSAFVTIELDETLNITEDGSERTSFLPGDEVWFWLQHDTSLRIGSVACTSGMAVDCGTVRRERRQELTFAAADSTEILSHLPAVAPSLIWYGNDGSPLRIEGRAVRVDGVTPSTCDVVLPIDVHLYRYVPPPLTLADGDSYRAVVVVTMEAA